MLKKMMQAARDAGTLKLLCEKAEALARAEGRPEPEAEDFVLAAIALPDSAATRVFTRLGLDGASFKAALIAQEREALRQVGLGDVVIDRTAGQSKPLPAPSGLYDAAPGGKLVVQELARLRKRGVSGPLDGSHVLKVVAEMGHGRAVRALRLMGAEPAAVIAAADAEIAKAAA